jgi:hypothetical protein
VKHSPWKALWIALALSAASAAALLALPLFAGPPDPFSAWQSPLEPWLARLHVLAGVAMVFALGWAFGAHVLPRLAYERRARRSGLAAIALAALMILSGYWLSIGAGDAQLTLIKWVHGLSGAAFATVLAVHAVLGLRASAPKSSASASMPAQVEIASRAARWRARRKRRSMSAH